MLAVMISRNNIDFVAGKVFLKQIHFGKTAGTKRYIGCIGVTPWLSFVESPLLEFIKILYLGSFSILATATTSARARHKLSPLLFIVMTDPFLCKYSRILRVVRLLLPLPWGASTCIISIVTVSFKRKSRFDCITRST